VQATENQKKFRQYFRLANQLMADADKDALAEVARTLALLVTYYESKHGKISMQETRKLLHATAHTDEEVGIAARAMEYLTEMMGATTRLADNDPLH
jgi:hypothetical protein